MVDVVGPRPDGTLVAAAEGRLLLVHPDGRAPAPFGSYSTDPGPESYIAMAPGLDVPGAGCRFEAGEIYALELGTPPQAVMRVTVDGQASRFVEPPPVDVLTGIAFDATGRFGYQLLVTGRRGANTVLFSIDCRGRLKTLTERAPLMEGGMEVAPQLFGQHGGDLIGADESTGDVIFIRFDGTSGVLIRPELPAGPDIGVGSVGFTPPGFIGRGGTAYVADRRGAIWRVTADAFSQVRIDENDLIATTEEGGRTVVVRCRATCRTFPFGDAAGAQIEGHVTVVLGPAPPPIPRAGPIGVAVLAVVTTVLVAGGFSLFFIHNRRKVRIPEPDRP
ncbi:MAG TPA: hypothetical protein VGV86_08995 [Acidimicrobiales bacterium]|nr:hypothetical protein [Acidimicrobiales bacterium]